MASDVSAGGRGDRKEKLHLFYEEFAEELLQLIKENNAPWQRNYAGGMLSPYNPITGTVYKGANRVKLYMVMNRLDCSGDPRFMTLKQANQCGWRVKKGEKSHQIVHWSLTEDVPLLDDENKAILDEEGNPVYETVLKTQPTIKYFRVFHASQLMTSEGKPIPSYESALPSYQWESEARAESVILNTNLEIIEGDPSYDIFSRNISMPPKYRYASPAGYYRDIMHELAHWAAITQFGIAPVTDQNTSQYARNELAAEICSWLTCMELGVEYEPRVDESTVSLIKEWLTQRLENDPYEIARAVREAEQQKNFLLSFENKMEQDAQDELDEKIGWDLQEMGGSLSVLKVDYQGVTADSIGTFKAAPYERAEQKGAVAFRSIPDDVPGMRM